MSKSEMALDTQREFVAAAVEHFGLDIDQIMQGSKVDSNGPTLDLVLRIALTPDDMVAIADRLRKSNT